VVRRDGTSLAFQKVALQKSTPLCDLGGRRGRQDGVQTHREGKEEEGVVHGTEREEGARPEIISRSCGYATLQMAGLGFPCIWLFRLMKNEHSTPNPNRYRHNAIYPTTQPGKLFHVIVIYGCNRASWVRASARRRDQGAAQ